MMVLSRKVGERIMIGDNIQITVIETRRHGGEARVRLGITAPKEVPVDRTEVRLMKDAKIKKEASNAGDNQQTTTQQSASEGHHRGP